MIRKGKFLATVLACASLLIIRSGVCSAHAPELTFRVWIALGDRDGAGVWILVNRRPLALDKYREIICSVVADADLKAAQYYSNVPKARLGDYDYFRLKIFLDGEKFAQKPGPQRLTPTEDEGYLAEYAFNRSGPSGLYVKIPVDIQFDYRDCSAGARSAPE